SASKPTKASINSTKQEKVSSPPTQNGHSTTIRKQEKKKSSKLEHARINEINSVKDVTGSLIDEERTANGTHLTPEAESVVEKVETPSKVSQNAESQSKTLVWESDSNGVDASEMINHSGDIDTNGIGEAPAQE